MKIIERVTRLERLRSDDGRMTPHEIAAAATVFEQKIASMAARPAGMTAEEAMSKWRALVATPNPGWWQRVFAGADLEDWFA